MLRTALTTVLLAMSVTATAEDFSYTWLQLGYSVIDFDSADGDGFNLGGAFEISDEFFLFGGYSQADLDFGIDTQAWNAGFGYRNPIAASTDLFATVSYEYVEVDVPLFGRSDDSGFGLGVGMRFMPVPAIELNGSINYVDVGDDDTVLELAGLYNFDPNFSIGLGSAFSDDATSWTFFGRWYFGR